MWKLKLGVFMFLCFASNSGAYFQPHAILKDMKWTSSPEETGKFIENQLARNESRFLSRQCFKSLLEYAKDLLHLKLWALLMFDASGKIPSGLLRGNGAILGSFDQCLKIQRENAKVGTIRGKYCVGRINLLNLNETKISRTTDKNEQRQVDFHKATVSIPWGVCLPDACTAKDFRFLHLFLLRFSEESCQTNENQSREFDNGDIAAISLLGIIAVLIVLSTTYDVVVLYTSPEPGSVLLRSFSLHTNFLKIITIKEDEDDISCIHGLRVFSMIAVIYGFRYALYIFAPLINWLELLWWILDKNKSAVLEAVICGDTFFLISGLLISYNYLKASEKGVKWNYIFACFCRRIIRLTPALGMTILIHATLLRHVGSGPVWPTLRDSWLVNNCRKYWWSSLLYVQNYVNPNITKMCVIQTWQLSVDMQLFILSPLILIPLSKAPKFTLSAVGSLLFCSILSPFLAAWVYKLKAIIVTNTSLDDVYDYMEHYYFPTHTRASSWLIGLLMGYYIYESKKPRMRAIVQKKLNKYSAVLLWIISLGILVFCIMIGHEMIGVEYHWATHAFHIALIRPAWSLAISWIIFACTHGYGGPVNSFLSASGFQMLSRITYCTYLVDISLMFIVTYQTRDGLEFSDFDAFRRVITDVFFSIGLGLIWTLAFESPLIAIGNVIFGQRKNMETKSVQRKSLDSRTVSFD